MLNRRRFVSLAARTGWLAAVAGAAGSSAAPPPAVAAAAPRGYRAKAEDAMRFLRDRLWDEKAGLFRPAYPADPKALPHDFMWGNGVAFSALVGGAAMIRPAIVR
jgi:hypothetical protein